MENVAVWRVPVEARLRDGNGRPLPHPLVPQAAADIANDDASILCVGSPASANLTPSLFEVYFEIDRPARLVLEHQSGSKPEQIYLRVFTQNSKWHAMARMAVRRV